MENSEFQAIASIINSLGVVGVLIYAWWLSRADMMAERARLEKQRQDDLARYEKDIVNAFARADRDLMAERNRSEKLQTAMIGMLKRTNIPETPDATEPKKERNLGL